MGGSPVNTRKSAVGRQVNRSTQSNLEGSVPNNFTGDFVMQTSGVFEMLIPGAFAMQIAGEVGANIQTVACSSQRCQHVELHRNMTRTGNNFKCKPVRTGNFWTTYSHRFWKSSLVAGAPVALLTLGVQR